MTILSWKAGFMITGGVIMLFMQISAPDALSNFSSWIELFGLPQLAAGLPKGISKFVWGGGAALFAVGVSGWTYTWLRRRDAASHEAMPARDEEDGTDGGFVPLADVAARTLIASRGRPVEPYLKYRAHGQADALRLTAEAITRAFPMWGRIPGTSVVEKIEPGTYSVYLDNDGALYATDNFIEKEQEYVDLLIQESLVEEIITSFHEMEASPFCI